MKLETSVGAKPLSVGDESPPPPVVVFLHGRGSDENSAAMFSTVFEGARLLAPRGLLPEGGGYAWFRNHGPGIADLTSLKDCVNSLEGWTDVHVPSPHSNLWLCGYSNGAALAGRAAARSVDPDDLRGRRSGHSTPFVDRIRVVPRGGERRPCVGSRGARRPRYFTKLLDRYPGVVRQGSRIVSAGCPKVAAP